MNGAPFLIGSTGAVLDFLVTLSGGSLPSPVEESGLGHRECSPGLLPGDLNFAGARGFDQGADRRPEATTPGE